jgi:predicted glycogen debranching enzyme
MSYLRFDKTQMTNLEEAHRKEVLRTNRSGAYSFSTVLDCNTRKYHGLLVVPVEKLGGGNHVLLSSLDETVIQHGAEFNLGLHKYSDDNYSPNGHKYIREFEWDKVPTTVYRVGGVVLKKERVFQHFENRIMIRYTLLEAHSETTLRLRPFLAFRSVDEYTYENNRFNRDYHMVDNGIKTCMYEGYPDLFMQLSKPNEFVFAPDWYRGIEYPKEQERGYAFSEDLYVPGYFEFKIKKGESVVFCGGVRDMNPAEMESTFKQELDVHVSRDGFLHCLTNAAHQFMNQKNGETYLLAGYPWFSCRARDMFIAAPGLTLPIGETALFEEYMNTGLKAIYDLMAGKPLSVEVREVEDPDVLLWAIWSIQQYSNMVSLPKGVEKYGKALHDILKYILDNKHPNLHLEENGLLSTNGKEKPVTWMNSTANGKPIVPRTGYVVEINALWYNALRFVEKIADLKEKRAGEAQMSQLADKVGKSFVATFLNQYGYLHDYVDGDYKEWDVRPNMIFAVSLENSPLTLEQKKSVLDVCTKELLTPKGLRTLSPKSGGYNPMYVGHQVQRDYAYHQGTAWPWLAGFYFEATLRVYKRSRLSFIDRHLTGYEEEMFFHALGTIPELFDGNPPFHGRGAVSFAMNVAEILRTVKMLEKFETM